MRWLGSTLDAVVGLEVEVSEVRVRDDSLDKCARSAVLVLGLFVVNGIEASMMSLGAHDCRETEVLWCAGQLIFGMEGFERLADRYQFNLLDSGHLSVRNTVSVVENILWESVVIVLIPSLQSCGHHSLEVSYHLRELA